MDGISELGVVIGSISNNSDVAQDVVRVPLDQVAFLEAINHPDAVSIQLDRQEHLGVAIVGGVRTHRTHDAGALVDLKWASEDDERHASANENMWLLKIILKGNSMSDDPHTS